MTTALIEAPVEVVPEVDEALGRSLGDEILLGVAASEKVAKVKAGSKGLAGNRAWAFGGNVD